MIAAALQSSRVHRLSLRSAVPARPGSQHGGRPHAAPCRTQVEGRLPVQAFVPPANSRLLKCSPSFTPCRLRDAAADASLQVLHVWDADADADAYTCSIAIHVYDMQSLMQAPRGQQTARICGQCYRSRLAGSIANRPHDVPRPAVRAERARLQHDALRHARDKGGSERRTRRVARTGITG